MARPPASGLFGTADRAAIGRVRRQENLLTNIYFAKVQEITQDCALKATAEAGEIQRNLSHEARQPMRPKMEAEDVTFAKADRKAYIVATSAVYDAYASDFPDLVAALRAAVGQ